MKFSYSFLFFSFILLSCFSFVSADVQAEHVFPGQIDISNSRTSTYDLSYYYSGWDHYNISFYDWDGEYTQVDADRCGGIHIYDTNEQYFDIYMSCEDPFSDPDDDGPYIELTGLGSGFVINPVAIGFYNSTTQTYVEDYFVLYAGDDDSGGDDSAPIPSYYQVGPSFKKTIPVMDVGYNDGLAISLSDYAYNFASISLSWHDDILASDFGFNVGMLTDYTCYGESGNVTFCVEGAGDDIILSFYSNQEDSNIPVNITLKNSYGTADSSFSIISTSDVEEGNEVYYDYSDNDDPDTASFIGYLVGLVGAIFPSSKGMTMALRTGYVLISLLLVNFLLLFGMYSSGTVGYAKYVLLMVNLSLVFFFTALNYIPISFVVICGLVLLTFGFFKVRGG